MTVLTDADVDFVSDIVKQAGKLAYDMRAGVNISHKGHPRDFVTDADIACSKLLVAALRDRFPQHAIVSEEDPIADDTNGIRCVWMIDPIDGTENYIANDGMYSVMVGLVVDCKPAYGWVYNPCTDALYLATPDGTLKKLSGEQVVSFEPTESRLNPSKVRVMMGNRDREKHPWVETVDGVEFVYSGSVGLRVAMVAEGDADVYLHLSGKLKVWDTAAPAAMALAAGLDIGSLEFDGIPYMPEGKQMHEFPVAFGVPGTLAWMRTIVPANR